MLLTSCATATVKGCVERRLSPCSCQCEGGPSLMSFRCRPTLAPSLPCLLLHRPSDWRTPIKEACALRRMYKALDLAHAAAAAAKCAAAAV